MKVTFTILVVVFYSVYSAMTLADTGQWYIGGGIGRTEDYWAVDDLSSAELAQTFELMDNLRNYSIRGSLISTSSDEWKLYAGYQLNDYLDVEAVYAKLGSLERSSGLGARFSGPRLIEETEMEGYGVSLVGTYPLTPSISVFAKAGAFNWETEATVVLRGFWGGGTSFSADHRGTDPMYGLGIVYSVEDWALRAEWERFTGLSHGLVAETDMDLFTLGIQYQFGFED